MTRINVLGVHMVKKFEFTDDLLLKDLSEKPKRSKKAKKVKSLDDLFEDQLMENIDQRNFNPIFEEDLDELQ
jgi:hypothetical protein